MLFITEHGYTTFESPFS